VCEPGIMARLTIEAFCTLYYTTTTSTLSISVRRIIRGRRIFVCFRQLVILCLCLVTIVLLVNVVCSFSVYVLVSS